MTISSASNISPLYTAASTGPFAFTFKVFSEADLEVSQTDTSGENEVVLTLTTDYTVSLNADQNNDPGGTFTLAVAQSSGQIVFARRVVEMTQETDLQNAGGFYPEAVEDALDKVTMVAQQVAETAGRALVSPASAGLTPAEYFASLVAAAGGITIPVPVAQGGTNATTAAGARSNLGAVGVAGDQMTGSLLFKSGLNNVASAATVNLTAVGSNTAHLTGTTGIGAFTMTSGQVVDVIFDGVLTLTHHVTNNNLPGAANITTAAGDRARYWYDGTTVWCVAYNRADGTPVAGSGKDLTARDQIALTNIRLMLQTAITTGALVQGKQWELATDEWGSSSTNQTYTAPGSLGYYANPTVTTSYSNTGGQGNRAGVVTVSHSGFVNGTAQNTVDGTTSGSNGCYPNASTALSGFYLQFDFGVGASKAIDEATLYKGNAISLNGTWKWQGSNNGSSWTDIGTTFNDDANTTQVLTTMSGNTTGYRYYRILATAGTSGGSVPWWCEFNFKIADASALGTPNMTLIPTASTSVGSAPSYMDAYFLYKDDSGSAVLGTDLTVELSRNNGTNYTTATITNLASYDGTYSILRARADVSGQPSGTSMLCRIKTLNNKAQRVAAPALYAE